MFLQLILSCVIMQLWKCQSVTFLGFREHRLNRGKYKRIRNFKIDILRVKMYDRGIEKNRKKNMEGDMTDSTARSSVPFESWIAHTLG